MPHVLAEPVDITPGPSETWTSVDITGHLPDQMVPEIAFIKLRNRSGSFFREASARKPGANWPPSWGSWDGTFWMGDQAQYKYPGVSGGDVELYREGNVQFWLYGAADVTEATSLDDPEFIGGSTEWQHPHDGNWDSVDLSTHAETGETPHMAFFQAMRSDSSGWSRNGIRYPNAGPNGTPWPFAGMQGAQDHGLFAFADGGEVEVWRQNSGIRHYITGYIHDPDVVHPHAEDATPSQTNAWTWVDIDGGDDHDHAWFHAGPPGLWSPSDTYYEVGAQHPAGEDHRDEVDVRMQGTVQLADDTFAVNGQAWADGWMDQEDQQHAISVGGYTDEVTLVEPVGEWRTYRDGEWVNLPLFDVDDIDDQPLKVSGNDAALWMRPIDEGGDEIVTAVIDGVSHGVHDPTGQFL